MDRQEAEKANKVTSNPGGLGVGLAELADELAEQQAGWSPNGWAGLGWAGWLLLLLLLLLAAVLKSIGRGLWGGRAESEKRGRGSQQFGWLLGRGANERTNKKIREDSPQATRHEATRPAGTGKTAGGLTDDRLRGD
jgi:hypothetical protein